MKHDKYLESDEIASVSRNNVMIGVNWTGYEY